MARSVLKKLVWKWGQSHYTDLVLASRIPCLLSPNTIGNGSMAGETGKQEPIPILELPVTAHIFICMRYRLHGNATNGFFESNGTESLSETASSLRGLKFRVRAGFASWHEANPGDGLLWQTSDTQPVQNCI